MTCVPLRGVGAGLMRLLCGTAEGRGNRISRKPTARRNPRHWAVRAGVVHNPRLIHSL
ncbi:hypothetical protein GCM10009665_80260 [Kitasatospora nipponensis]|uniref:Uncharacterized protein n=1 Tax=Kitasatospora nipponensis TaxID=258049 RepID=A0ABN1TFG0_9ACTN